MISHRSANSIFALSLITAAFAFGAVSADAATFCIDVPGAECPAGATAYSGASGISSAITDSVNNGSGQDTILIYSGAYQAATGWDAQTSNVKITGVGPTKPVLSVPVAAPSGTNTLKIANAFAQISNLAVVVAGTNGSTGITSVIGGSVISDVEVSAPASAVGGYGIEVVGQGSSVLRATITMPQTALSFSEGIVGSASSSLVVNDSTITATRALWLANGSANVQIRRANANACTGAKFQNSWGTISSSLLVNPVSGTPCNGQATGIVQSLDDGLDYTTTPVLSVNNTIVGHGYASDGAIQATTSDSVSKARINVNSSVLYGFDKAFRTSIGGVGSTAVISADFSRYQGTTGSATLLSEALPLSGDPGFVDAAGGNFTLQKTSQLIDVGNPAPLTQNESSTDLLGAPRVASRGAGNIRDIGAYELSNAAPTARIAIATANPVTTSPTTFSGSGSSDPDGDTMTYSWRFDNGQLSAGESVNRYISTSGTHSVELTVTDSTGVPATTSVQYTAEKGTLNLALNKKALRASGRGDFSVKLFCPDQASSNCNGKLIFATTGKKPLRAAAYVFSVEPGTTRKLPITTYKSFRKLLIKQKKIRLKVTVSGTTGNATLSGKPTTFSLSAPKKK